MSTSAETVEPEKAHLGAFLAWVVFALLVAYTIFVGGSWVGMHSHPLRVISLAIIAVAFPVWAVTAWRRPEWRPSTAIWPAFSAPLAAFVLSTLASLYPRSGLEFVSAAVVMTALYLLLVRVMAMPYARIRIGGLMAIIAVVASSVYVVQSALLWLEWWDLVGELRFPPFRPAHLSLTWGSPSIALTMLILMTTVAIGMVGLQTRGRRAVAVVLVSLLAAAAIMSGSRSGWLALGGAIVIVGALYVVAAVGRSGTVRALRSRRLRIAVVPAIMAFLAAAVLLGPAMINRLGAGDGGRLTFWASASRMALDRPILGQGPGTWMVLRSRFTEPGEIDLAVAHAHGQYFQIAAEFGIVGFVAGAIVVATVGWLLLGAIRGADDQRRRWAWASVFAFVYLALNIVVDVHTIPAVAIVIAIPIAALDASSDNGIGLPASLAILTRPLRIVAVAGLAVVCALSVLFLARGEAIEETFREAVSAISAGDWDAARSPAMAAAEADPEVGVYQVVAGLTALAAGDWEAAADAYTVATALDGLAPAWLGLAIAQLELGHPDAEVAASLQEAMRLGRQQSAVAFASAQLFHRLGMEDVANEAYAVATAGTPSIAADAGWRSTIGAERFDVLVDDAIELDPATGWQIAMMAGQTDRARTLAEPRPDADLLVAFIDAWNGDDDGLEVVQGGADADPTNELRLNLAIQASARAGDEQATDRYLRLMWLAAVFDQPAVFAQVGERDPVIDARTGAEHYLSFGNSAYRRDAQIDLLPPWVPGLTVTADGEPPVARGQQPAPTTRQ